MNETPAWDAWCSLTQAEMNEVARLSRKGQRHPDPRVAAAAEGWARVVLGVAEGETPSERLIGGAIALVFEYISPSYWFGADWLERRWARRVLAAR